MLGNYGETLVVDWGLAKIMGQHEENDSDFNESVLIAGSSGSVAPTLFGSAIGTPAYMPPEQAAGRTDQLGPHSDIYSLGATLFYILTGQPPFHGKTSVEILDLVKSGDFDAPKAIDPSIPSELNAICLKAMATDPSDRYPSTVALSDDIERYLADESVSAIDDPISVRARRWIRKHPTITATSAAGVLISAIALIVFSTIVSGKNSELANLNSALDGKTVELEKTNAQLDLKNNALETSITNEQAARKLAQENEKKAAENYDLARQSVDKYFTQISENKLLNEPYMDDLRNELLASASEFYLGIVERRSDDPTALMDLGTAQANLGRISWEIGDSEKAIVELESARKHFLKASKSDESQEMKLKQLWGSLLLSNYYEHVGRTNECISLLNQTIEDSQTVFDSDPSSPRVVNMYVRLISARGGYFSRYDDFDAAIEDHKRVVSALERIGESSVDGQNEGVIAANSRALCKAYTDLGAIKFRQQRYDDCKSWYEKAVKLRRELARRGDDSILGKTGLASSISMMAQYYRRMKKLDKAMAMAEEATQILATLADEHPQLVSLKHEYFISINNLALIHQVKGNLDKADLLNDEVCEILSDMVRKHPTVLRYRYLLGTTKGNRGNTTLRRKDFQEAIGFYDESNKTMMEGLIARPTIPGRNLYFEITIGVGRMPTLV